MSCTCAGHRLDLLHSAIASLRRHEVHRLWSAIELARCGRALAAGCQVVHQAIAEGGMPVETARAAWPCVILPSQPGQGPAGGSRMTRTLTFLASRFARPGAVTVTPDGFGALLAEVDDHRQLLRLGAATAIRMLSAAAQAMEDPYRSGWKQGVVEMKVF